MNSVISFIIVLGGLIFVHELGHFLFAKLFNVKVLKFSLGFGPKLVGYLHGETEYLISAFPLGGYVKMLGENANDVSSVTTEDEPRSFARKPVWQRFAIVAAGPLSNLFFAVFLFSAIFGIAGVPEQVPGTKVGAVAKDTPAERAGILSGDAIIAIDGKEMTQWEEISRYVMNSSGAPLSLTIKRGEELIEIASQPTMQETHNIFGEVTGKRYLLGISKFEDVVYKKVSVLKAIATGFSQTWAFIYLTIMGFVKMLQKVIPASELGGPILIAQMAGKQFEAGWLSLLHFTGLVSVNLGILNLLPVPILDGGHLVFFSVEALRRRPVSMKTQEIFQQIGLILLASLMIFVFYNDIMRIFTSS